MASDKRPDIAARGLEQLTDQDLRQFDHYRERLNVLPRQYLFN
jgi:hypothetical protein